MGILARAKAALTGRPAPKEGDTRVTDIGTRQKLERGKWRNIEQKPIAQPREKKPEEQGPGRTPAAPESPGGSRAAGTNEATDLRTAATPEAPAAESVPAPGGTTPRMATPEETIRAYGFASAQEHKRAISAIIYADSIEDQLSATPAGRAALIAVKEHPQLIGEWMRGEVVPPIVAMGFRQLWTLQQYSHGDGKSLIREGDIEGVKAVEMTRGMKAKMPPVTPRMREAVEKGRLWAAQKGQGVKEQLFAQKAEAVAPASREGETLTVGGVTYELQTGATGKKRYHRTTPKEGADGRDKKQPEASGKQGGDRSKPRGDADTVSPGGGSPAGRAAVEQDQEGAEAPDGKEGKAEAQIIAVADAVEEKKPPATLSGDRRAEMAAKIIRQQCEGPEPHIKLRPEIAGSSAYDHQLDGAARIVSAFARGENGFLLGDGMGSGKTITILAALAQMKPKRATVVVPNQGLVDQWIGRQEEGGKGGDLKVSGLADQLNFVRAGSTTEDYSQTDGIRITTYAALRDNPSLLEGSGVVVFDEAHMLANQDGATGQAGDTIMRDAVSRGGKVLFSTATPFQKAEQMRYLWPLGLWDDDDDGKGFDKFAKNHGVRVKRRRKNGKWVRTYEHTRTHAAKLLGMHQAMLERGNYLHREMRLDGLTNNFVTHSLPPEQRQMFDTVMKAMDRAARGKPPSRARSIKAQRMAVAMRMLESFMVPQAVKAAQAEIAADEAKGIKRSAAFFVQSVSDIDLAATMQRAGVPQRIIDQVSSLPSPADQLVELLGGEDKVMKYYGPHRDDTREYNGSKDDAGNWIEPTKRLAVVSYSKGGTGLSIHDKRGDRPRSQYNLSVPYSALQFMQATARSHRLSSASKSNQYFLLPEGVEEMRRFARITGTKLKNMGAGIRGLEGGDAGAAELAAFEAGDL